MEDWLTYNMKVENEAVENLMLLFRDHIEDHLPIQKEMRIEVIDIVESYKHLNFNTPAVNLYHFFIHIISQKFYQPRKTIVQIDFQFYNFTN